MNEQQQIRDALSDIDRALQDHNDFGPHYDENELNQITALRDQLRERLQLTGESEQP